MMLLPSGSTEGTSRAEIPLPSPTTLRDSQRSVGQRRFLFGTGDRPLEGYTIKYGIGHGGFGEVYYAVTDAGKEVALKLLRQNLDVELRGVGQCLNLKHPHLLSIYDIRRDHLGNYWIVMEHVAGESLEDRLGACPAGMPVEEVASWFQGIASGLAYLHDQGIVHRDLKPSNIFREEGIVKIGDYGLCKFISYSRRSGQTESVGTVHYMAPEIANGRYGREVDIYALGILLYEMLTGRPPFEGESVGEILMKHMVAQPDLSVLPESFRPVVAKALEKDPEKRYRSVREMLAEVLQAASVSAAVGSRNGSGGGKPGHLNFGSGGIARGGLRQLWRQLRIAWQQSNLDTPTKLLLLAAGLIFLLATAQGWIPVLIVFLILYGSYLFVRGTFAHVKLWLLRKKGAGNTGEANMDNIERSGGLGEKTTASGRFEAIPVVGEETSPAGRRFPPGLPIWARKPPMAIPLQPKSFRQRLEELLAGLLRAFGTTIVMSLVMLLPFSFYHGRSLDPELAAWLVAVSVLSAWLVIGMKPIIEKPLGDPVVWRFLLMVGGLVLGGVAFGLAQYLEVQLPLDPRFTEVPNYQLPASFYDPSGQPRLPAYLACFGSLFVLIRWWRQIANHRPARLSVLATAISGLAGWIVAAVWFFPQPWLMMIACSTSVAVQLSSPWKPPQAVPSSEENIKG
jgi:hypothetical protein